MKLLMRIPPRRLKKKQKHMRRASLPLFVKRALEVHKQRNPLQRYPFLPTRPEERNHQSQAHAKQRGMDSSVLCVLSMNSWLNAARPASLNGLRARSTINKKNRGAALAGQAKPYQPARNVLHPINDQPK